MGLSSFPFQIKGINPTKLVMFVPRRHGIEILRLDRVSIFKLDINKPYWRSFCEGGFGYGLLLEYHMKVHKYRNHPRLVFVTGISDIIVI